MDTQIENINRNNLIKNIIIFSSCLIIAIGISIIFFADYIYNFNDIVNSNTKSIYYFKWIMLGFLLNIIFLITLSVMKSYKNNIIGERGPRGFKGRKGINDEPQVICTRSGDHEFEYNLENNEKYKFQEDIWKK